MKLRRALILTLFVGLALSAVDSARADDFSSAVKAGNKSYGRQDYESAMRHYQDAEIERPEAPKLHYNIANTLYGQERYEEAVERYNKAFYTEDPKLEAHTYYNQGNALYRAGKLAEAIQAYEKCLDLTPDDVDAKYNLEFVRKKLKEMMDQQKQQEKQQEKQEGQPQRQQPGEESEKKQDQSQSAQKEEQEPQADSTQAQPQIQPEPQEGMSREEAERILNALKSDEKELLEDQRRFKGRSRRVRKDW
jgi:Ca-activated chloride channel family protein